MHGDTRNLADPVGVAEAHERFHVTEALMTETLQVCGP